MTPRIAPFVVVAVVLGAGGVALLHSEETPAASIPVAANPVSATPTTVQQAALPPNHPPIDRPSPHGALPPASDEAAALAWQAPPGWQTAPNPNTMRIASYRPAGESSEAPEISITRAGGSSEANIQRWLNQFDNRGIEKRTLIQVHGLDIPVVEVSGTYTGGSMMPGSQSPAHAGWTLVGAIVPAAGSAYFFKLLGPSALVKSARPSFDALIGSATPR